MARNNADNTRALDRVFPPRRGRRAFAELCRQLESIEAHGKTNLAAALHAVAARADRPGMLLLVSDFLDPGPIPTALNRLSSAGHNVVLLQVLDKSELDPDFEGDLSLEDSETGERLEVTVDPAALNAYAERLAGLFEELRGWAKRHGATYSRVATGDDLQQAVRRSSHARGTNPQTSGSGIVSCYGGSCRVTRHRAARERRPVSLAIEPNRAALAATHAFFLRRFLRAFLTGFASSTGGAAAVFFLRRFLRAFLTGAAFAAAGAAFDAFEAFFLRTAISVLLFDERHTLRRSTGAHSFIKRYMQSSASTNANRA